jgi:hypothetical protein
MRKRKSIELFAVKETTVCMNSCLAVQFSMGAYLRDLSVTKWLGVILH